MTLAHRSSILGGADPRDPRAGYPLGILALRGDLAEPGLDADAAAEQSHLRYLAGTRYGHHHAIVWNARPGRPNPSPRSPLGALVPTTDRPPLDFDLDDEDPDTNRRRRERQLRAATARVLLEGGDRALRVLDNIVVYDHRLRFMDTSNRRLPSAIAADRRDKEALRAALGALVIEYR